MAQVRKKENLLEELFGAGKENPIGVEERKEFRKELDSKC